MINQYVNGRRSIPLEQILIIGSKYQTNKLKERLIKQKLKEYKCEICNLTTWQGVQIPLELNHKNGINNDHRLENLELICPNCHALTDSYRGKNRGKAKNLHHYKKPV